jgi:hypothetical protein
LRKLVGVCALSKKGFELRLGFEKLEEAKA